MIRKFISTILSLCLLIGFVRPVCAAESDSNGFMNSKIYPANIAYVENVNETGTNIYDETINGSSKNIPNSNVNISMSVDNTINVIAYIGDTKVVFNGNPVGRSESGKTVFYSGTSNNSRYEVVYFSYILDTSTTNMYFKDTKSKKYATANTMLKLYVKDVSSDTLDYYFIEVFNIDLGLRNDYIQVLPVNPLLGAWVATQFSPIDETFGEDTSVTAPISRAASSPKYWFCTKTYYGMGENQTHTIKWRTNVDYSNIIKGQEAKQYFRLTVYAKNMKFDVSTDLNSNTMSYLHVDKLRLCQTSVPYTAWKGTSIDGKVQNNGGGGGLSASIGVSYGLLNISYSVPISFSRRGTVDINKPYNGYENGVSGNYTRSIETKMNSDFKLTKIDHYFEVISTLRDYGNAIRSGQTLQSTWYVDIINASTMERCSHTCSHNVSISIIN